MSETAGIGLAVASVIILTFLGTYHYTVVDMAKKADRLIEDKSSILAIYPKYGDMYDNTVSVYSKDKGTGLITKEDIEFIDVKYQKKAADISCKKTDWIVTLYIPLSYVDQDKKADLESKAVTVGNYDE